jgi:hypothetical protein
MAVNKPNWNGSKQNIMNKVQQAEQKKVLGIVNALQKSIRF